MRRLTAILTLLAFIMPTQGTLAAVKASLGGDYKVPIRSGDSEFKGRIKSPNICPADPDWVSFEVENQSEIRLWVYNEETADKFEITSAVSESSTFGSPISKVKRNRDLAWCPVEIDGKIWAVFVGDASGSSQLYLINMTDRKAIELVSRQEGSKVATESEPSWSPDGTVLTYVSNLNKNLDIMVVRDMEKVIAEPTNPEIAGVHELFNETLWDKDKTPMGEADEYYPVWHPGVGSGWLAFNRIDPKTNRGSEIRIVDALTGNDFAMALRDTSYNYDFPSWSSTGKRLAFRHFPANQGELRGDERLAEGTRLRLGIAEVNYSKGELFELRLVKGGKKSTSEIMDVAPNHDRTRGPAWLPDTTSRGLLAPEHDEANRNPLQIIDFRTWELGRRNFMTPFAPGYEFAFPEDLQIVGSDIVFTFAQGQERRLLKGRLAGMSDTTTVFDYGIPGSRTGDWSRWAHRRPPGKGIPVWVFIAGGAGLVAIGALVFGGGGNGDGTDWTPPQYPDPPGR